MPRTYFDRIEDILSGPNPSQDRRDLDEHALECQACTRKLGAISFAVAPAGMIPIIPNERRGTANEPLLEHVRTNPGQTT